ncbi:MAG: TolC family protein, partial [Candidatus Eisenbacteria bacterium]
MVRLFHLVLVAVLFSSLAHAQPRVSEEEFLSILRGPHPGLVALSERLGTARAERVRAGLLPNPVGGFEREAPRGGAEQSRWRIAWTPPLDGRRGAAVRAAEAGLQAASHELEASRLSLRSELRQRFAEWSLTAERTAVIRSHLGLIERLAEQGRARARSGEASGLAARRLALAALEVQAEAARTEASATNARALALAWHREL